MSRLYKLDGHIAVPMFDILEWGRWLETADRIVARTPIGEAYEVSTVFLGIDHSFTEHGSRKLFETMVFQQLTTPRYIQLKNHQIPIDRDEVAGYTERYATWEQAEIGHQRIVQQLTEDLEHHTRQALRGESSS